MSKENLDEIIKEGYFTSENAFEKKIIDGLKVKSQVYEEIENLLNIKKPNYLFINKYADKKGRLFEGKGKSNK